MRVFLEDIKESIDRVEEYTQGMSKEHFMEDIRTQDAIIRRLEIIGEAVNIPEDFGSKYPDIPLLVAGIELSTSMAGHSLE